MNWQLRIAEVEEQNAKLDYNQNDAKVANLLALQDEILSDSSIDGIIAVSALARALDRYDKSDAEKLELAALTMARANFPHFLLPILLQVGCFYSKHEELEKAAVYTSRLKNKRRRSLSICRKLYCVKYTRTALDVIGPKRIEQGACDNRQY